jgi:hypothetical protein
MAKSLEEGFGTFLSWLVPLNSEHSIAASHKESVYGCLYNKHSCNRMFETGSFGAGTGVRHCSDTDYFAVFPAVNLWTDSAYTLRQIKESLQNTYSRTDGIVVNTPAVRIPFGSYASEMMEVTPCCTNGTISTAYGNFYQYEIPDGSGGWLNSSPSAFNSYVNFHNNRLNKKLKPLIQLIKAWKYYNDAPISSFYLELRATKYAEGETTIVYDIDLYKFFKYLSENELPSINDPLGISGRIHACTTDAKFNLTLSKVQSDYKRAEDAFNYRSTDLDKCFERWNLFFNHQFPNR